jgi:Tol biopolymer transport system component
MSYRIFASLLFTLAFLLLFAGDVFSGKWLSPVQLTDNTASEQVPVINADGTKIVYYSDEDGDNDIYFMEYKNSLWQSAQKITFNATSDTMPTINDKGNRIAFIGGDTNDRSIYFVEYADENWREPVRITDTTFDDYFPSISADGTRIIFQSKDQEGKRYIRFIQYSEGQWGVPIALPSLTDNNMFPEINSDGTKICFHAEKEDYRHIYFSEYSDNSWGEPLILTRGEEQNIQVSINSDGTKIVFYWTGEKFLSHVNPQATADIRYVEYKQGSWQLPITIAGSPLYEFDPTISGDGSRVTYAESNPGLPDTIYIVEHKDGIWQTPENLTQSVTSGFRPYINHYGDRIVYYGTGVMDSDYEVYLLSYDPTAGELSGNIAILPNDDPLESALVITDPGGYLATTDEEGFYRVNVPSGNYTIRVVADCFESSYEANVTVEAGGVIEQNFSVSAGNCAPNPPVTPSPAHGAPDQPLIANLSWNCSDPDEDTITYDVFLGVETDHHIRLALVSSNQSDNAYKTELLNYSTSYYWQVIARDDKGAETASDLWHFTTGDCPLSLLVEGNPEDIQTLRDFRDTILHKTPVGRGIIKLYYSLDPALLKVIRENTLIREQLKGILHELLPLIRNGLE